MYKKKKSLNQITYLPKFYDNLNIIFEELNNSLDEYNLFYESVNFEIIDRFYNLKVEFVSDIEELTEIRYVTFYPDNNVIFIAVHENEDDPFEKQNDYITNFLKIFLIEKLGVYDVD